MNVHIYPSPILHESRMLRITRSLAEHRIFDKIILIGKHEPGLPQTERIDDVREIVRIPVLFSNKSGLLAKLLNNYFWTKSVLRYLKNTKIDVVNCHSLPVLPLCVKLSKRKKALLIYDTHELETETSGLGGLKKKLYEYTENRLFRFVDYTFTVCDSIGKFYQEKYGTEAVGVVRNIPETSEALPAKSNIFREQFSIPNDKILFICQGILEHGRSIERILRVFEKTDRHIVFMGRGPLEVVVTAKAAEYNHIHFHPFVSPDDVLNYTSSADVGLCLIENTCLSYYYSLPNKLFEYFFGGLAAMVNDLPEQKNLVETYHAGWVVPEDDDEFLQLIESLDRACVDAKKKNTELLRRDHSWQQEEVKLIDVYLNKLQWR